MTVAALPSSSPLLRSSFQELATATQAILDAMPTALYVCAADGVILRYNQRAAELWGRTPRLGETDERYCGSFRLYQLDGRPLAHADTPMAQVLRAGQPAHGLEVLIERPDGSRRTVLVHIEPLLDDQGGVLGAINGFQDISDRKAVELELRQSRQDLEDFFENGAVGLHLVAADGTILRANRAELDLLGYTADEYIGRPIADVHADAHVIRDILQRLSRGETLDRYPARLRAKDGSIRHVLITSNAHFRNGELHNTRCFTVDVTDQHRADEALRDSQQRLAVTYEKAPVGIAEVDLAGRFVRINAALSAIIGYAPEELVGRSFIDLTHPEDRDDDAEQYARQVRGEITHYSTQKRFLRRDGGIVFVNVLSSSVLDRQGQFRYGVRVVQDVTEQRQVEERLRESERHVRELLEALPAAIYTTDAAGRITYYNQAAVEFSGRRPILGSDEWCVTWRLFAPDGTPLPHDQCPMAVALREGRAVRGAEAIAERPDGTRVPFIPFPTPLRDASGRVIGAINMLVDITERKQAEEHQKVLIDELNHRVKNTLATVQSIATQTVRTAPTIEAFSENFEARLLALSKAHELLTRQAWTGVNLRDIVCQELEPYDDGSTTRVRLEGPDLTLEPRVGLALSLVLHELTTNAAKYGALSTEQGLVTVRWSASGSGASDVLRVDWIESGGPAVTPPAKRSFGTRLIERSMTKDLQGKATLDFDPAGLRCILELPLAQL
ncbi:PAS domain-containing sensor histidine kinase [Microvirga tunisiensis]|uniref:PAS domain-containing sensor histidine kinase n=1 Tax=Microvirga tunisiensis TaxID=2108360 RepID=UPI00128E0866|nr:PAS domain S-box protein [Microvirga tunisiensis]MPR10857.1 PAS domain S-box protein [Microvirga tunisiensis]